MLNVNDIQLGGPVSNMKLQSAKNDTKVLKFTITTFKQVKDGDDIPQFHNVVFFNRPAEIISKHVNDGDRILIDGSVEYRKSESGEVYTSIVGSRFSFID